MKKHFKAFLFVMAAVLALVLVACTHLGHVHKFQEFVAEKPASCEVAGQKGYQHCDECNKNFDKDGVEITDLVIPALGHNLTHVEEKAATCEEDGNIEYWHCERCEKNFSDQNGENEIAEVKINKLGHDYELKATWVEDEATQLFGFDHYLVCKNDETHIVNNSVEGYEAHIDVKEVSATCIARGSKTYTLTVTYEGKTYTATKVVELDINDNHSITPIQGKAATTSEAGYLNYFECQNCHAYFEDEQGEKPITDLDAWKAEGGAGYIAPIAHDHEHTYTKINGQNASCEKAGYKDFYYCTLCGTYFAEENNPESVIADLDAWTKEGAGKINPLGHVLEEVRGEEPTQTEAGYKSFYTCEICDKDFEDEDGLVEITDFQAWISEGGNGYLPPLGFVNPNPDPEPNPQPNDEKRIKFEFTNKDFGATADDEEGKFFEDITSGQLFEDKDLARGIQIQEGKSASATTVNSYNNITKIIIVASSNPKENGNKNGNIILVKVGKGGSNTLKVEKGNNQELTIEFDKAVSGQIEIRINSANKSVWIKSIEVLCESSSAPEHNHDYSYEVIWKETEAYLVATCSKCNEGDEGHKVETKLEVSSQTTNATCTETGKAVYTAVLPEGVENNNFELTKTVTINALGHNYGEPEWAWDEHFNATVSFTCDREGCAHVETPEVTVSHEETKAVTDTEDGVITYTAKVTFEGKEYIDTKEQTVLRHTHEYSAFVGFKWNEDKTKALAVYKCNQCNLKEEHEAIATLDTIKSVAASCDKDGKEVYTVSYLEETGELEIVLPKLGHTLTHVEAKEAKCNEPGNVEYWHCSVCGKNFADEDCTRDLDKVEVTIPHGNKNEVVSSVTFDKKDFNNKGTKDTGSDVEIVKSGITVTTDKGFGNDSELRVYSKGKISIDAGTKIILELSFNFSDKQSKNIEETYKNLNSSKWELVLDGQSRFITITIKLDVDNEMDYILTHVAETDSTCSTHGNIEYWYCEECGTKFDGADQTTANIITDIEKPLLPHTYNEDDIVWVWATNHESVTARLECTVCHGVKNITLTTTQSDNGVITVDNTGKVFTATLTIDGNTFTKVEDTSHEHVYATPTESSWTWTGVTSATLTLECTDENCPDSKRGKVVLDAVITNEITTEPTCGVAGVRTYTAKATFNNVDYTTTKTEEVAALEHSWSLVQKVEATAEIAGNKEYAICDHCNKVYLIDGQLETINAIEAYTGSKNGDEITSSGALLGKYSKVSGKDYITIIGYVDSEQQELKVQLYRKNSGNFNNLNSVSEGTIIRVTGQIQYFYGYEFYNGNFELATLLTVDETIIPATGYKVTYMDGNKEFTQVPAGNPERHFVGKADTLTVDGITKTGYTLEGWYNSDDLANEHKVTEILDSEKGVTLYAKWTANKHTVAFKSQDGSSDLIAETTYDYNTAWADITKPENVTKASTNTEVFTFVGWATETNQTEGLVTPFENLADSDIVLYAAFSVKTRYYTVRYLDDDNSVIETVSGLEYNANTPAQADPKKESTKALIFTFTGWTPTVAEKVTESVDYIATYSSETRKYDVVFTCSEGIVEIADEKVDYNNDITFTVQFANGYEIDNDNFQVTVVNADTFENISVEVSDNQYTIKEVACDILVDITGAKLHGYKITYMDDATTPFSGNHEEGYPQAHVNGEETVLKSASKEGYTFGGWYNNVDLADEHKVTSISATEELTDNITLYAKWTINTHAVIIAVNNAEYGSVNIKTVNDVPYGASIVAIDNTVIVVRTEITDEVEVTATPKNKGKDYTYSFVEWTGVIATLGDEDLTITANFTRTLNKYTIMFVDDDNTEISSANYDYGTTASDIVKPTEPTKAADQQYTYTFSGWDPVISNVTEDKIYVATYSATVNTYTIKFVDDDNTELSSTKYNYGTAACDIILPADPTKDSTTKYSYTFSGWTPAVVEVTGNATYKATYTATGITYSVIFNKNSDSSTETMENLSVTYGDAAKALTANKFINNGYRFMGWATDINDDVVAYNDGASISNLEADLNLYAIWKAEYSIVINNSLNPVDNTIMGTTTISDNKTSVILGETILINFAAATHPESANGKSYKFDKVFVNNVDLTNNISNKSLRITVSSQHIDDTTKELVIDANYAEYRTVSNELSSSFEFENSQTSDSTAEITNNNLNKSYSDSHFNISDNLKVYLGANNSLKMGSGSSVGYIQYSSKNDEIITGVDVEFSKYGSNSCNLVVTYGDKDVEKAVGDKTTETIIFDENNITSFKIASSSKQIYIYSVTIHYIGKSEEKVNYYTVSINKPSHGSINGLEFDTNETSKTIVVSNNSFEVTPAIGYVFLTATINDKPGTIVENVVTFELDSESNNTITFTFSPITKNVRFDANNGSGEMANLTIVYDEVAKQLTTNSFVKKGYTISKWNTQADGKGIDYALDYKVSNLIDDLVLYAQWSPNTYSVTFDKNSTDAKGEMASQTLTYDEVKTLNKNAFIYEGHVFMGWAIANDGDVKYTDEEEVINLATFGEIILYAVWQDSGSVFNVTFDLDGKDEDIVKKVADGNTVAAPDEYNNATIKTIIDKHYKFAGWYVSNEDNAEEFDFDETTISANTTIYAKWDEVVLLTYKYSFIETGNDTEKESSEYVLKGSKLAVAPDTSKMRDGKTCDGWYIAREGNAIDNYTFDENDKVVFDSANGYEINTDITLYASWKDSVSVKTITLDALSFGLKNSYEEKNATISNYSFTVDKGYKNGTSNIQMNSNKGNGILYNTTEFSKGIKSITINVASGDKTYTLYTGSTQKPTSNSQTSNSSHTFNVDGDTYFEIKVSGATYFSSIVIEYYE